MSNEKQMSSMEREIALFMVDVLNLEIDALTIDPEEQLFGDGLGLDSIDGLELGLMLAKEYHVKVDVDDSGIREKFHSLRTLAKFVEENKHK